MYRRDQELNRYSSRQYSSEKVMWMMMMGPAPENTGLAIKHFDWPPTVSDPPSTS